MSGETGLHYQNSYPNSYCLNYELAQIIVCLLDNIALVFHLFVGAFII